MQGCGCWNGRAGGGGGDLAEVGVHALGEQLDAEGGLGGTGQLFREAREAADVSHHHRPLKRVHAGRQRL